MSNIQNSPTYQELLAAIEANPDDETPKLILADYCEETGRDDLAYAFRWCAERGKWLWMNVEHKYDSVNTGRPFMEMIYLGTTVTYFWPHGIECVSIMGKIYHSAHDAVADLARVLGEENANNRVEVYTEPHGEERPVSIPNLPFVLSNHSGL